MESLLKKEPVHYILSAFCAVLMALDYEIFIFPNNFAPAGLNGLATMVQYLFHFYVGYMSLIINIPLCIICYFTISRHFAKKTLCFVLTFSAANILFRSLDFTAVAFYAKDGGEAIMAAVAAGFFVGLIYNVLWHADSCTGGTDIVARFINKKKPEFDYVWIIFALNALVAVCSFFVYGGTYQPVILCIIYIFTTSRINDGLVKGAKAAAKFEVVTDQPEALSKELIDKLGHTTTMIQAQGMYSHTGKTLLVCVVNRHQAATFERIIGRYPGSFVVASPVTATMGNFKHIK